MPRKKFPTTQEAADAFALGADDVNLKPLQGYEAMRERITLLTDELDALDALKDLRAREPRLLRQAAQSIRRDLAECRLRLEGYRLRLAAVN